MYVGSNEPVLIYVREFDFQIVDSITILGMSIHKNIDNLSDCHLAMELKVTKIINFWDRFYLSLPGRLNIVKTLLLSHISYLGCIITPAAETLRKLKKQIEKFIVGKLNVARERIYKSTELGGLGMIDIEEFLVAQQVSWFKRANQSTRDNWRVDLKNIGNGNVLTVGKGDFSENAFPIFRYLVDSYVKFLTAFNRTNNNFAKALILNNPLISVSREDKRLLNNNFFSRNMPHLGEQIICHVRLDQVANNGRLLSLDEITANTGINVNLVFYLRLQTAYYTAGNARNNTANGDGSSLTLSNFFKRFRKGSKQIRNILSGVRTAGIRVSELRNIITLENLLNSSAASDKVRKSFLCFWGFSFLPTNLREFSFKFFNNSLGLNSRLPHFVAGRGGGCTFCSTNELYNGPVPAESFLHFFFDCTTTRLLREWFEASFMPEIVLNSRDEKIKFWFFGSIPLLGDNSNLFILSMTQTFFYSIWRFKLLKRKPVRLAFELEFFYTLGKIVEASRIVREHMTKLEINLCRNWDDIWHRRG